MNSERSDFHIDFTACKWTRYFNRDNQHYTGDHESLSKLRRDYPGQICSKPVKFEARTVQGHIPYHKTGEKLTVSLTHGLTCLNKDQRDRQCKNYEIRFCCPASQSEFHSYLVAYFLLLSRESNESAVTSSLRNCRLPVYHTKMG